MLNKDSRVIFITCFFSTISFFLIDFYLPSLPSIAHHFNAIATNTQLIVSCYLIGLGISQLVFGVLSDRYGRKNILLIGILIALLSNSLIILATNLDQILILRAITGLGAGACPAIARAILGDKFEKYDLLKSNSYLSMSITMSPAIAPVFGGIIQQAYGWKISFLFVSGWCVIAMILLLVLFKETLPIQKRSPINAYIIKKICTNLIVSKDFISSALISCLAISAGLSYYLITPFLFQNELNLSPVFNGFIYVLNAMANLVGACYVNHKSNNMTPEFFLELGTKIAFFSSALMLGLALFTNINMFTIVCPMLLVSFSFGLIMPSSGTIAIRKFKVSGGTCAAILGFIRMVGSAVITSIVAFMNIHTQFSLALVLLSLFSMACILKKINDLTPIEVLIRSDQ